MEAKDAKKRSPYTLSDMVFFSKLGGTLLGSLLEGVLLFGVDVGSLLFVNPHMYVCTCVCILHLKGF